MKLRVLFLHIKRLLVACAVILISTLGVLTNITSAVAAPQTYSVNVTSDESDTNIGDGICETENSGECTLRAAIEESNTTNDADTIEFNIPGSGTHTINVASHLPTIEEPLTIDGYSQPGSSVNTAVSPAPINSVVSIQLINSTGELYYGLGLASSNITIKGLAIDTFRLAIKIDSNNPPAISNINIYGNYLGTDTTGLTKSTSEESTSIESDGFECSNIHVGSTNPEDRNILGGSNTIVQVRCDDYYVYGNYIGIGRDGVTDITGVSTDDGSGIGIQQPRRSSDVANHLVIGGSVTGAPNVIGGTPGTAISIQGNNNVIQGNYIGTDYTGHANPNTTTGFGVSAHYGSSNNLIGGTNPGEGNTISGVGGAGVGIAGIQIPLYSMNINSENIAILGNSIYNVTVTSAYGFGSSNIGIELTNGIYDGAPSGPPDRFLYRGPNPHGLNQSTQGPNNFINAPILHSAIQAGNELTVTYDLDVEGSDSNQYRVEYFANDTSTIFGSGPGQTYLGYSIVDTSTNIESTILLDGAIDVTKKAISATVTPLLSSSIHGFGGTSEFSQNIQVGSTTDFDADGISDSVENASPNSGDANNDGIQDSQQSTVSSYKIGNTYVSFVSENCIFNGNITSLTEDALPAKDGNYSYPFGLTDFSLTCTFGDTAHITKYVYTSTSASGFLIRKYRPDTHNFETVDGTVESTNIAGNNVIVMSYDIQDGGNLDDDGIANGVIKDPVGLAEIFTSSTPTVENPSVQSPTRNNQTTYSPALAQGRLPSTGAAKVGLIVVLAIVFICSGFVMIVSTRAPKN